jgi:hypothetical protein
MFTTRVVGDLDRVVGADLVGDQDQAEYAPQSHRAAVVAQVDQFVVDRIGRGVGQIDDHGRLQVRPSRAIIS